MEAELAGAGAAEKTLRDRRVRGLISPGSGVRR